MCGKVRGNFASAPAVWYLRRKREGIMRAFPPGDAWERERCPATEKEEGEMLMKLETTRLTLRTFEEKDAPGLLAMLERPGASCFAEERLGSFGAALEEARRRRSAREGTQLAVCLKESGGIIGNVFSRQEGPDTWSVGWMLNERFQGRGYASEAARAYVDFLFSRKGARRVYAYVEEGNLPSRRLCERLGMRKEACFVEFIAFRKDENGTPVYENTLVYAVLKREWGAEPAV